METTRMTPGVSQETQLNQTAETNKDLGKVIEVYGLTKRFEGITAVDNISFVVNRGDIFAFLGPNGAGKSTAIKILTTVLRPTEGEILVNGYDVEKEEHQVRGSIGVVFQEHSLDTELTAYENLYYHCALYKVPKKERKERIEDMLNSVGLWNRRNHLVKTFSGGMMRRVEIIRGLLHYPKILVLDEPTSGLDAQTRFFLWNHLEEVNHRYKVTIFLTSHNLEEIEKVSRHTSIIDKGKILANGTNQEIKEHTNTDSLEKAFLELTGYSIRN